MGVKKVKISSVKRAQHMKKKSHAKKPQKPQQKTEAKSTIGKTEKLFHSNPKKNKSKKNVKKIHVQKFDDDEDDEQIFQNVADVLDEEDLEQFDLIGKKPRKRKIVEDPDNQQSKRFENDYAQETLKESENDKVVVNLLPIKSKDGQIITRTAKVDYKPRPRPEEPTEDEGDNGDDEEVEYEDSDDDIVRGDDVAAIQEPSKAKLISTTDLLIRREQEIEKQKYRIGIICSGILEKPEDKMRNFSALFEMMEEKSETGAPNLLSIRKLAMISIAEIFKDIIPEYRVGQVDTKMTTVRKATLERATYENALLQQFKKYLQKLERITSSVTKKNSGRRPPQDVKLAEIAVNCMCDILVAHPYFNYVQNIAQLLVYMLNCRFQVIRESINKCFRTIFSTDQKLDMTLFIIRRINHLVKSMSNNAHLEVITCFMSLRIKSINLDAEKENELKQKKLEAHRQRLLSLSKKEKKRRKRLNELNKELQETKAEENKQSKHYKLTEITKMMFTIYFRVLKNDPGSRLLGACLEGLAEFAHVINLDFFSDLIDILNNLLETTELGYREHLHCIQTIFSILSGQGEALNIDPIRFYGHLYKNLLVVNAGKNHNDFKIILRTLDEVLLKRRKNITQQRLMAFVKRILTLSLQLLHNGSLGCLGVVKNILQHTSALDIMLDTDASFGSGRFDPEIDDPEYCNAMCTSLYELTTLLRHYHPTVRKIAMHIATGVPTSGEGSLPVEIGKLSPLELFDEFDSSEMAFKPSVPVPKPCEPKFKGVFRYLDPKLDEFCRMKVKECKNVDESLDFSSDFVSNLK